jgi:hypothetical protein
MRRNSSVDASKTINGAVIATVLASVSSAAQTMRMPTIAAGHLEPAPECERTITGFPETDRETERGMRGD